jgi:hypothetical protein
MRKELKSMSEKRNSSLLGKVTLLIVICCLVLVGVCVNTALALSGSGTQGDPWRIESLEDFNDFAADANYWAGFTRLETDVNLAGITYSTAVIAPDIVNYNVFFDGTAFTGVFDGNDHKIINLTISDGGSFHDYLGLFGYIDDGEVRNLGLEGGSVSGFLSVGGLVGKNNYGNVSNCYSTGAVNGDRNVGGLVGPNMGNVSNCYSTSSVSGQITIGGLVASNFGSVSNCYSFGDINGFYCVGGLVGDNNYSSISNCYSTGDVNGTTYVGGLVGRNWYSVVDCYSTGDVNGTNHVGGLVGLNIYGDVSNCYSTGDVHGGGDEEVGGLVGSNFGYVRGCFWDIDSQNHDITESIGLNKGTVSNVEGLPTYQLHQQSTFTNWDFINIWNIGENQTYPYLRVYLVGDINKDRIVNFLDVAITANQWMEEQ